VFDRQPTSSASIGLSEYKTTYGEVTEQGIYMLSERLKEYTKTHRAGSVFYDLGSGVGKVIIGIAALHPELRCVGIEIVPDRVRIANASLERIKQKNIRSRIIFHHGDFLSPDLNFRDAACLFISNLCFTENTNARLAEKITREAGAGCIVIVSREIPIPLARMSRLESHTTIPMTWSSSSTCFIYRMK